MDLKLTEQDFKDWLKRCKPYLGDRSPDEIASLARFVGFPGEVVYPMLSHFEDALRGSNFDNRAKMQNLHETITIELLSGKPDMMDRWRSVARKERGDE